MIHRTATAACDAAPCSARKDLDPSDPQPYQVLTRAGWRVVATVDGIDTYCPDHVAVAPA